MSLAPAPVATVAASTGHKVLVSVHGVGDQFNYETIQSVALRLSAYYGERSPIALGSFYQINAAGGARVMMNLPARGLPANVGFGEVYWADIPRRIIKEGYQLEESKKWAKTIVGRVAANARQGALEPNQVLLIENVLEELIDTVAILERLCFIAEKAGVFTFSLQRVLAEFVNDVQLVADFPRYREEVLHQFDGVMDTIAQQPMRPDMYLITHSEGTVVMLAGLLRALRKVPQPDWLGQLRGIMTIGSPLDTHMLLWPEMWSPRDGNAAWRPATAIPWFNYYDRGDPIADSLKTTRAWLETNNYEGVFDIHDIGFARYYFPGKAHIDYWQDDEVFGHFIEEVVKLPPPPTPPAPPASMTPSASASRTSAASPEPRSARKPGSKRLPRFTCYVAPYALIAALIFGAVFVLFQAVRNAAGWEAASALPNWLLVRDVAILASLLAGMSVAVRMPRLSTMWRWRLFGYATFLAGAGLYLWPVWAYDERMRERALQDTFAVLFGGLGVPAFAQPYAILVAAGAVVVVCALFAGSRWNRVGIRLLLISAGVVVLGVVAIIMLTGTVGDRGPIWPLLLSVAAFFYMWWLALLLFDLVFVWHRYIRHSVARDDLAEIRPEPAVTVRSAGPYEARST